MRCKACNTILTLSTNSADDGEYCWNCKSESEKEYGIHEREHDHAALTSVPLDGSTISLEDY